MAQPAGIHARRAALRLIDAVLRRGETLERAAPGALRDVRAAADQALAKAISAETLRWLCDLDALIDSATQKRLPDDAKARSVLRLMLAQTLRLGTPPHAVIATGLPLLPGGPRRLAHGVFSTLIKREERLPDAPTLPAAVIERWGQKRSAQIAQGLAQPPEVDLRIKKPADTALWQSRLGGVCLARGHVRLARGIPIEQLEGYEDGAWWVQDLAAQIPAILMGPGPGPNPGHALDLCAAPGGKTMALAASGWNVTALDISKRRIEALKSNLKRTQLQASTVRADALKWQPKHTFDAVLLDAPCTATGTCRRHPDALHRIRQQDIAELVGIQRALVKKAAEWLKPGGTLVYAVCSLEREEGEEQARWIDQNLPLERSPIEAHETPAEIVPSPEGWLRTHPGLMQYEGGLDGFFIARWHTKEEQN